HPVVSGGQCGRRAPGGWPIEPSEPPQRSEGPEDQNDEEDPAPGEAGDTYPRKRAFALGCPPPEFGIGDERETGIESGWIARIAHQRPRLEMGWEILNDHCPAFP